MKPVKFLLLIFGIGLCLASCTREIDDSNLVPQKLYPVSVTRTASYTTDTIRSDYSYNPENQITREDVFKNRKLQSYNLFTYNASGKLVKKAYYDLAGFLKEQDEISYNGANQVERLSHAYVDAAGQATPHHSRLHEFNAEGKITKWTDFTPANTVMGSRTYAYPNSGLVTSPSYDSNGQLLNTSEITFDTNPHPFVNTGINLVTFAGNESRHIIKNPAGQETDAYTNVLIYNEAGYPEKLTQTHTNGVVKTETYRYKNE